MKIRLNQELTMGGVLLTPGTELDLEEKKVRKLESMGIRFETLTVEVQPSPSPVAAKPVASRKRGLFRGSER